VSTSFPAFRRRAVPALAALASATVATLLLPFVAVGQTKPLVRMSQQPFSGPRESGSGDRIGLTAREMARSKIMTLWQTHKKSKTALVCPTATFRCSRLVAAAAGFRSA
jgi:hypothetical protein